MAVILSMRMQGMAAPAVMAVGFIAISANW